ncbi:olfactory receptor 2D3-like [Eublepharis macularius]|uniref:Olfactory receptor n=1 Tax=Eublepharis macularius TaxID=481883 RepID=A0AA97K4S7_EUBMA|nr:olfactory receptor 2D3-like [Eublepharis macularius]
MENQTTLTYFVLLGFSYNLPVQIFLFLMFLFIYATTVLGNTVIITIITTNNHLRSPMYFFLSHLSFLDICFSSVTLPNLLLNFYSSQTISYSGCIAQMFLILQSGWTEVYILAAMAFDRYTAICKPLHYVQIMNRVFCRWLVGAAWVIGYMYSMVNSLPILKLTFCGQNVIRHFSCEYPSLLALSCTETFLYVTTFFISGFTIGVSSSLVILCSYVRIVSTVLKMQSAEARKKTFSTCSAHLIVVILYYGTGCTRYMRPMSVSLAILDELFSIQYSILTPMLNPIIYSLKTREIREALKKILGYKPLTSCIA